MFTPLGLKKLKDFKEELQAINDRFSSGNGIAVLRATRRINRLIALLAEVEVNQDFTHWITRISAIKRGFGGLMMLPRDNEQSRLATDALLTYLTKFSLPLDTMSGSKFETFFDSLPGLPKLSEAMDPSSIRHVFYLESLWKSNSPEKIVPKK